MSTTITDTTQATPSPSLSTESDAKYDYANLPKYVHPPETKEDLPWAELVTLDLEEFSRPGGKERLAKQLEHAVHHVGFFYVKNYGISQEDVDNQFTLAKNIFDLPVEEKQKYELTYGGTDYNGWRRPGLFKSKTGLGDNIELWNVPKFTKDFEGKYQYPPLIKAHLADIEKFQRALHGNVLLPLLRLFAIVLQLEDEEYLVRQHTYEEKSEDHIRYMVNHPRTDEEWEEDEHGIRFGHTDLGTVTLLFRQPVAGLQILGEDGKWTYVSPQPGTITVNLGDTISHLTGGWLKSSVHRVYSPPLDQRHILRTGVLYFARPHNQTVLNPITDSPVLKKAGVETRFNKVVTAEEFVRAKQELSLRSDVMKKLWEEGSDGTMEVIGGFKIHTYKT